MYHWECSTKAHSWHQSLPASGTLAMQKKRLGKCTVSDPSDWCVCSIASLFRYEKSSMFWAQVGYGHGMSKGDCAARQWLTMKVWVEFLAVAELSRSDDRIEYRIALYVKGETWDTPKDLKNEILSCKVHCDRMVWQQRNMTGSKYQGTYRNY